MPEYLADPVGRLLQLHSVASTRILIALAGYPGSGKSTVVGHWSDELRRRLDPEQFRVLGMDGFHLPKSALAKMDDPETAFARRGAPFTFDPVSLVAKIRALRSGWKTESVGWPGFEHAVGDPVPDAETVPPNCPIVLVEGIYTLLREGVWSELDGLFDEGWFLDTPLEVAMGRLYRRHQDAWGVTEEDARKRADGNDRLNCAYIAPGRETADFLISLSSSR